MVMPSEGFEYGPDTKHRIGAPPSDDQDAFVAAPASSAAETASLRLENGTLSPFCNGFVSDWFTATVLSLVSRTSGDMMYSIRERLVSSVLGLIRLVLKLIGSALLEASITGSY